MTELHHHTLAELAQTRLAARIVTQNVDGLHVDAALEQASRTQREVEMPLELHGSLFRVRCTRCADERVHRERIDASSREQLPTCDRCGALLQLFYHRPRRSERPD